MTKIAEGQMIVKRLHVRIPPMKGEAIIRTPVQEQPEAPPDDGKQEDQAR